MIGRDPYDALLGVRVPAVVRENPRLRQVAIQARKRSPIDLGPLIGVRPFRMAKADGCFLTACARHHVVASDEESRACASQIVDALDSGTGCCGAGAWSYEFDVQTRWSFYAAGSPNLIATTFVAKGYLSAGVAFGEADWLERGLESADYVSRSLTRSGDQGAFVAYVPHSDRLVHNANALGAGLLAAAGALSGRDDFVKSSLDCALTTVRAQRSDGSWPYGDTPDLGWSDNFHTAYTLDGLLNVWLATADERVRESLDAGVRHWVGSFFDTDGGPRYYPHKAHPYDIHSAATAVDTAFRLAAHGWRIEDLARRVAKWTRAHLVDGRSGKTYFQKHRMFTDRRHFVRWGDAHWALATASERIADEGLLDPLEGRISLATGVGR